MEYKVYRERNQHLVPKKIKIPSKKVASVTALARAIHDLGELGDPVLQDHVTPFLIHPNPILRYEALSTLGHHWMLPQYRAQFEEMMRSDSDEDVRRIAASCLGLVLKGTRDKAAAQHLIAKLRDENEDGYVREGAYDALLDIWAPESEAAKSRHGDLQTAAWEELYEKVQRARERGEDSSQLLEAWDKLWMRWVDWHLVDKIDKESQLDKA